jgi:DNA-binding transcriptional MocR family regulator
VTAAYVSLSGGSNMILLKLDRRSKIPLYFQIINQIIEMVEADILKPGTRLPSTRLLAETLAVNRSTVYNAYQELWAQGYIDSRPGSYSLIRKRHKMATPKYKEKHSSIQWDEVTSAASQRIYKEFIDFHPEKSTSKGADTINFAKLDMDHRLFPSEDFRRCLSQVMLRKGSQILGYGDYMGYNPLRETIAKRLQFHGISVSSDEILITNGSQNGIELILKLFSKPGKKMIIESPTYAIILPLLKYYQTELAAIPILEKGLDLNKLKHILSTQPISFLYTIPNFHNPTGITTTQSHRESLLSLCETYNIPIVEDGFEEEMKYFGKVPPPIKSMDKKNICIYLGTFSKVLFPGIRIGWIAAERACIMRLTAIKRFSDLTTSFLLQAAINEFCEQGYYDIHIKRMHRIYRKRMCTALNAISEFMPEDKVSWTEPTGGYLIWLKLRDMEIDESHFLQTTEKHGAIVSPGRYYFYNPNKSNYFRISISTLNEEEIAEGIKRLALAIDEIYQ